MSESENQFDETQTSLDSPKSIKSKPKNSGTLK